MLKYKILFLLFLAIFIFNNLSFADKNLAKLSLIKGKIVISDPDLISKISILKIRSYYDKVLKKSIIKQEIRIINLKNLSKYTLNLEDLYDVNTEMVFLVVYNKKYLFDSSWKIFKNQQPQIYFPLVKDVLKKEIKQEVKELVDKKEELKFEPPVSSETQVIFYNKNFYITDSDKINLIVLLQVNSYIHSRTKNLYYRFDTKRIEIPNKEVVKLSTAEVYRKNTKIAYITLYDNSQGYVGSWYLDRKGRVINIFKSIAEKKPSQPPQPQLLQPQPPQPQPPQPSSLAPNQPPIAENLEVTTQQSIPVAITLRAYDPENSPLTYIVVSSVLNGALIGEFPEIVYIPFPDFIGTDIFTFKVNDGELDSNIAEVKIVVNPFDLE